MVKTITKARFKKAVVGTGGIMINIATKLGVSRNTVYLFCNKYPDMMELRRQEEEKILDLSENSLYNKAHEGEMWAVKFLLATKGKKRGYVEKQQVELEGNLTTNFVSELSKTYDEYKQTTKTTKLSEK